MATGLTPDDVAASGDHVSCDSWDYDKWSMSNVGAWGWKIKRMQKYIELACLRPRLSPNIDAVTRKDLERVYHRIIYPALSTSGPYVFEEDRETLRVEWVSSAHGLQVPITDFFTAFSWVVTMTESPMISSSATKYTELLCVFTKWCSALAEKALRGGISCQPNTTVIFWMKIPSGPWKAHYAPHSETFAIFSNLPQKPGKEQARLIRRNHLVDNFGDLGIEPKAVSGSVVERNTKFGHCAETLALTSSIFPDNLWCHINALAVGTDLVIDDEQYIQSSVAANSTAYRARKQVCSNCDDLLGFLREASKQDSVNYTDWWYTLREEHDALKTVHVKTKKAAKKAAQRAAQKKASR